MTKFKTEVVTKLKNSKCDHPQKLKMWQNSKSHVTKLENSSSEKTEKNQIMRKFKHGNCDKTQIVTNSNGDKTENLNCD